MENFLHDLELEVGEVKMSEELCPGVYYFCARSGEYFATTYDAPEISGAAKAYGEKYGKFLLYPLGRPASGWMIVRYEACKYLAKHGLPLPEDITLCEAALFGMEYHPDYFGTFPVPVHTPHGNMLRYQNLANGVCWIETDRCLEVLAVSFPIWDGELSEAAQKLALEQACLSELPRYLFFKEEISCIPLFELMQTRSAWKHSGIIDEAALMNAIWQNVPAYALAYNGMELAGLNDIPGTVLNMLGSSVETSSRLDHAIRLTPDAGTMFFRKDKIYECNYNGLAAV